jgi:tetratricopeptide (TPR) repeat protein
MSKGMTEHGAHRKLPETDKPVRVFISCVSAEFKTYRLRLANQLGSVRDKLFEVKVQEDFQQAGATLLESLADYIRNCDVVIHLVGEAAGDQPSPDHERALLRHLKEPESKPLTGYSYTQWEYHIACSFGKRILVYLAMPEARRDCGRPVPQSEDDERLQQAHLSHLFGSGRHYAKIDGCHALIREAFHDLGLNPDVKANNIPYKSLGSLFKGREPFMDQLRAILREAEFRGHRRVAAITAHSTAATVYGLGGIGKTRAVVEFAHRYADDYSALLFVRADSPENLKANLAALCGAAVLDLAGNDANELDVRVSAALRWLCGHPGWLLIFDNVDSEAASQAVEALLPRVCAAGQVLITSRLSTWSAGIECLSLNVLKMEEAVNFLIDRTAHRRKQPDDAEQAVTLAKVLGQLPLALEQAGAMIAANRYTFAKYLDEWNLRRDRVLAWVDERAMQYPLSVAVTWQTSFDQLPDTARQLMHRLAWLAPDPIPESLLDVPVPGVSGDLRDALADLEAFSLVSRANEQPMFSVHRLIQDVTRRSLVGDPGQVALKDASSWMNAAIVGDPTDVRLWRTLEPLAPHVLACAQFADDVGVPDPTARLLNDLGLFNQTKAQFKEAEPLLRRALTITEATCGSYHLQTAIGLNNLASCLQAMHRFAEAEPLLRRALAINEDALGRVHPGISKCLNNLAELLRVTNRYSEAEALMRQVVEIDEHGHDPSGLATALSNLAALLRETNRLSEAEPLMRRALAIAEEHYNPVHPDVANRLANLAQLLQDTNRLSEAESLMHRALAISEDCYGPDHPRVANDLMNLASLLRDTNRLSEAEPLMRRAISIAEATYGADHPSVAMFLTNLSALLQDLNRSGEAEPMVRRALAIAEETDGPDHPNVATDLFVLATLLVAMQRPTEAEPLWRRALEIDEASYGPEHPVLARDLAGLADLLQATDRSAEAEPLLERALAICEMARGPHHPDVARLLTSMALLLKATNRLLEAEPLMRRALVIFVRSARDGGFPDPYLEPARLKYRELLLAMGRPAAQADAALREIAP